MTESIVSLERWVCSCAELQVFSCYRSWKEACQATRAISTTSRRQLSSSPPPPQGKGPKEIYAILIEKLGEHELSYATVKNWVAKFKRGDFSTCDALRPEQPKTVTTPEIIDQIHELILVDHRNQCSGGITADPAPKYSEFKNPVEEFSPRFFGIKTASFPLSIFQRAKLSTRSITHLCWWNWRTFWRKNAAGRSLSGPCSCMTMPRLTGHLQPRRNWLTWASNILIAHPILRTWPRRTTTCSLDWKKQLKGRHFPSDAEVIAVAETWLDGRPSTFFFERLAKVRATG